MDNNSMDNSIDQEFREKVSQSAQENHPTECRRIPGQGEQARPYGL
jgi:hypothetical protein